MEENLQEYRIFRKIEAGKKYRVFKSTHNDRDFYRIQIQQKNYDGTKDIFYESVQFKKNINLPNETDIIIKNAYENCRANPLDKYNPIFYIVITDFEIVERQEQIEQQALEEYRNGLDENSMDIDDENLPF